MTLFNQSVDSLKVVLGDQSPWNGGLLRASVLRDQGIKFTYGIHDADTFGVAAGREEPSVALGYPSYAALTCRLPFAVPSGSPESNGVQQVLQACVRQLPGEKKQRASVNAVAYIKSTSSYTIRAIQLSESDLVIGQARQAVRGLFDEERNHLEIVSGKKLPVVSSINEACDLHGQSAGINVGSTLDLLKEDELHTLRYFSPDHFWGIDHQLVRHPYDRSRTDWYAVVPRARVLFWEYALRGYVLAYSNCSYLSEVVNMRHWHIGLRQIPLRMLRIGFNWRPCLHEQDTPFRAAWEKKGKPSITRLCDYWATRPTSMGLAAFGGDLSPTITEEVW